MNKKIKYLLIFLAFILLIFIISIGSKLMIIENLKGSIKDYLSSNNHYVKIINYNSNPVKILNTEIYEKNDIQLVKNTFLNENMPCELITYHNGDNTNSYFDNGIEKIAKLNFDEPKYSAIDDIYPKNFYQDLKMAIFSSITLGEYQGEKCYIIRNIPSDVSSLLENSTIFVGKDTGLLIKSFENPISELEGNTIITSYYYEFNNIKDEDIKEPDINQYTVK